MRPSEITRTERELYHLHVEILKRGVPAYDYSRNSGGCDQHLLLDWAIDYSKAIPDGHGEVILRAHMMMIDGRKEKTAREILAEFYRRLEEREILMRGIKYLRRIGR